MFCKLGYERVELRYSSQCCATGPGVELYEESVHRSGHLEDCRLIGTGWNEDREHQIAPLNSFAYAPFKNGANVIGARKKDSIAASSKSDTAAGGCGLRWLTFAFGAEIGHGQLAGRDVTQIGRLRRILLPAGAGKVVELARILDPPDVDRGTRLDKIPHNVGAIFTTHDLKRACEAPDDLLHALLMREARFEAQQGRIEPLQVTRGRRTAENCAGAREIFKQTNLPLQQMPWHEDSLIARRRCASGCGARRPGSRRIPAADRCARARQSRARAGSARGRADRAPRQAPDASANRRGRDARGNPFEQ